MRLGKIKDGGGCVEEASELLGNEVVFVRVWSPVPIDSLIVAPSTGNSIFLILLKATKMSSSNSIEVPQESTDFLVALMFDLALLDDPDLGKGKSPPSLLDDFHFAVRLQDEEEKMLLKDLQMARSISGACAADGTEIETIVAKERQDEADRRLALALSSGQSLDRSDSRASTVSSSEGYGPALLRSTTSSSSSFATLVDSSSPKAGPSNYGECASCYNETSLEPLPCKHKYCRPCIIGIVRTAAQDMSLIPARCCGKPFPDFLLAEICKSEPSVLRAYNAMKAHRQEVLKEAERSVDAETGEMFQRAGLKRCPGCQLFVQKAFGCNHMT